MGLKQRSNTQSRWDASLMHWQQPGPTWSNHSPLHCALPHLMTPSTPLTHIRFLAMRPSCQSEGEPSVGPQPIMLSMVALRQEMPPGSLSILESAWERRLLVSGAESWGWPNRQASSQQMGGKQAETSRQAGTYKQACQSASLQ